MQLEFYISLHYSSLHQLYYMCLFGSCVRIYYIIDADIVIMYNISVHMHAGTQTKLHLHHTASYIQSIIIVLLYNLYKYTIYYIIC